MQVMIFILDVVIDKVLTLSKKCLLQNLALGKLGDTAFQIIDQNVL